MTTPRRRPPDRRGSLNVNIDHNGHVLTLTVSRDRGRIAEVFVSSAKSGSDLEAVVTDTAIIVSVALQHGVPINDLVHSITKDGNGTAVSIIGAVLSAMASLNASSGGAS